MVRFPGKTGVITTLESLGVVWLEEETAWQQIDGQLQDMLQRALDAQANYEAKQGQLTIDIIGGQ